MSFDNDITVSPEQLRTLGIVDAEQARKNFELLQKALGHAFGDILALSRVDFVIDSAVIYLFFGYVNYALLLPLN